MSLAKSFLVELELESENTRKLLECIPEDKISWKPHEKSMSVGRLGMHIAELPGWFIKCLESEEFDFSKVEFKPFIPDTKQQIMEVFETSLEKASATLYQTSDDDIEVNWKFVYGDRVIFDLPRIEVLHKELKHLIHHRGQLTVFLRLLNVPLPPIFGPTADMRN